MTIAMITHANSVRITTVIRIDSLIRIALSVRTFVVVRIAALMSNAALIRIAVLVGNSAAVRIPVSDATEQRAPNSLDQTTRSAFNMTILKAVLETVLVQMLSLLMSHKPPAARLVVTATR